MRPRPRVRPQRRSETSGPPLSIELAARDYLPEEEGNTLPAGTEQHHGRRTMSRLAWGVKLGGPKLRQARRPGNASNNARADEANVLPVI